MRDVRAGLCAAVVVVAVPLSWALVLFPEGWEALRWLVLPTGATGLLLVLSALLSVVAERGNRNVPLAEQLQALRVHPWLGVGTLVCLVALGVATFRGFAGPGAPVEELGVRYFDNHGVRTVATPEQWMQSHAWVFLFGCAFGALSGYTARSLFDVLDRQNGPSLTVSA